MNSTIFVHRGKKKPQESQDRRTKLGNRCYLMSRQCVAEVMKVVGYQGKKINRLMEQSRKVRNTSCRYYLLKSSKGSAMQNHPAKVPGQVGSCTHNTTHYSLGQKTQAHTRHSAQTHHTQIYYMYSSHWSYTHIHRERNTTYKFIRTYHTCATKQIHITYIGIIHKYTQQAIYKCSDNTHTHHMPHIAHKHTHHTH